MASPFNTASKPFDFVEFFSAASAKYTKQNRKDLRRFLREHPLASGIDRGDRDSVLDIFQKQVHALEESREGDTGLFGWLKRIVDLLNDISEDEDFEDCLSFVRPAIFLMIHSVYFTNNSLSNNRYFGIQSWFTLVLGPFYLCVSFSLSPTHSGSFSYLGPPGGQACERKLRRSSRYIRMRRDLPQSTQDLCRDFSHSRDD